MKDLLNSFLNSLYNPEWLKKQRSAWGKAWIYFTLFIFVYSVAVTLPLVVSLRQPLVDAVSKFSSTVPNFNFQLNNGTLIVGELPQPYIVNFGNNEFVLVVDTVRTTTAEIADYVTSTPKASVLVTALRAELTDNEQGTTRIQNWQGTTVQKVTKAQIEGFIKKFIEPGFYFLGTIVLFIGLFIGSFVSKLYIVALTALFVSVIARLSGRSFTLKELFVMGLYAITLPALINIGFTMIGIPIGYVQFLALFAFMIAVVFTEKRKIVEE